MLHGYMFLIRSRVWIPAPAGITAGGRYTTHVILNLILLISRDAIHMVVCRYTHRSVVLLQADDWNQLGLRGEHRCSKDDNIDQIFVVRFGRRRYIVNISSAHLIVFLKYNSQPARVFENHRATHAVAIPV